MTEYIPPMCMMQVGRYEFMFDIITSSNNFQKLLTESVKNDWVRDLCDPSLSELNEKDALKLSRIKYLFIVQKSPLWFFLRGLAQGTASTVGKYIKGPKSYPTTSQILGYWNDKISKVPFKKTHTMTGHMNWGVGYEDPALLHFAKEEKVCVSQVGTIRVDLTFIIKLAKIVHSKGLPDLGFLNLEDQHLLVSPDGLVSEPEKKPLKDQNIVYQTIPKKLLGMLEIKCISPFHHVESSDGYLEWVNDLNDRQWYKSEDIPFVYIIQMTMQAMSGVNYFKMNGSHIMWFIRWSPSGLSIFKMSFKNLIKLGTVASLLYFSMIQRIKKYDRNMFNKLTAEEQKLSLLLDSCYRNLMKNISFKYVKIEDYPEFDVYKKCTEYFKFKIQDIDPDILQTEMPKRNPSKSKSKEVNAKELMQCML